MSDDTPQPHLRLREAPGGRERPATVDVVAYIRGLADLIGEAFGKGRAMVLDRTFVDAPDLRAPEFVLVPVHGLTSEQAEHLANQWSLEVCDVLGIEPQARPSKPPELALRVLDETAAAVEKAAGDGPDGPDDGAA